MAQAFGEPAFPVDTHIHRLAGRWGLSRARNVEEVERDLKRIFPRDRWNALHLRLIYYGREHCTARGCDGTICEVCATLGEERMPGLVLSGTNQRFGMRGELSVGRGGRIRLRRFHRRNDVGA